MTPHRRCKIFQVRWQGLLLDEPLERSILEMDAEGAKERLIFNRFSNAQAKGQGQKTIYRKCGNYLSFHHTFFSIVSFRLLVVFIFDLNDEESHDN